MCQMKLTKFDFPKQYAPIDIIHVLTQQINFNLISNKTRQYKRYFCHVTSFWGSHFAIFVTEVNSKDTLSLVQEEQHVAGS